MLKGDARARVLPANLDHLRLQWRKRRTYETAWVRPGTTVYVRMRMDVEQQSDHKLISPSDGVVIGLRSRVASSCLHGVQEERCQRE